MAINVDKTLRVSQISKIYLFLVSVIVKPIDICTLYTFCLIFEYFTLRIFSNRINDIDIFLFLLHIIAYFTFKKWLNNVDFFLGKKICLQFIYMS